MGKPRLRGVKSLRAGTLSRGDDTRLWGGQTEERWPPIPGVTWPACPGLSQPLFPCCLEQAFSCEGSKPAPEGGDRAFEQSRDLPRVTKTHGEWQLRDKSPALHLPLQWPRPMRQM